MIVFALTVITVVTLGLIPGLRPRYTVVDAGTGPGDHGDDARGGRHHHARLQGLRGEDAEGTGHGFRLRRADLDRGAAISFDQTGTTKIGKYVLNHSFMLPGLVATIAAITVGFLLAQVVL